ncbi:hypothetical protein ACLSU7_06740 [Bdellovibrio sp. HCB185ZH]|uniref:hypothetical protein n=1 Tax=Bdellovibrio sp. HCB185ZH TaxID=3394235 RepID=UPI0039A67A50
MLLRVTFLLLTLTSTSIALAGPLPAYLRDGGTRFLFRTFGTTCYSMDSIERGLPCNPAFIAKNDKKRFDSDLFLGTNMDYLSDVDDMVNGHATPEQVNRIFSRREASQAEASLEAAFQARTWGLSVEPYRLVFYTDIHNSSLPAVNFIGAEEKSLKLQFSSYVSHNFYAGIQLRYTHVKFVGNYIMLTEALADDSEEIFRARTQDLFYIEPGFVYSWDDEVWKPQVSAMFSQWGFANEKSEQYPVKPQGMLGASIKPPVGLGVFEVGTQVAVGADTQHWQEAVRAAMAYKIGILQLALSGGQRDHSAGFLLGYKNITSGLSYWGQDRDSGVYISFGVTL